MSQPVHPFIPDREPLWTTARLRRLLIARYGIGPHGGIPAAAVAAALGVSPRTVHRWLHTSSPRSLAHIPPRRLAELKALVMPSEQVLRDEQQAATYAENAISALRLGRGRGVLESWTRQRWLEEHIVLVREVAWADTTVRHLRVVRADRRAGAVKGARRIVDEITVPTKFHGTALASFTMDQIGPWRIHATAEQVGVGFTQVWSSDAPRTHLMAWADLLEQRRVTAAHA